MRLRVVSLVVLLAVFASVFGVAGLRPTPAAAAEGSIAFRPIGTYATNTFAEGGAEIVAYDSIRKQLFAVNGATDSIDVINISNPSKPTLRFSIDISPYGGGVNSVDYFGGFIAAAIEGFEKTDPGKVVFFESRTGSFVNQVTVGALPDMIAFSPNGRWVLTANEGEPNDDYSVDPEGSIGVIDTIRGVRRVTQADVRLISFTDFNVGGPRNGQLPAGIRIFGPNATVAQDFEPEYIAVDKNSTLGFVTLQENNALAVINIPEGRVVEIVALGLKNHNLPGNALDASDRDNAINIRNWPVYGMYMPDAISAFRVGAETYLITANEGDARDYDTFAEEIRVGSNSYRLDPTAFPNASDLKRNGNLGRLTVTTASGDTDGDGDFDQIHAFGSRSFTIWNSNGELVWDSGDQLEQITAAVYPENFNANNEENDFDTRSDNKGPEPEAVTTGVVNGRELAFVGLERIGGVMIYDISNPTAPEFIQYVNNRDFYGDPEAGTAGDLGPEGVIFVNAERSPSGKALMITANEISGTVTIYEAYDPNGAGTLTLLHNNDGESSLLPLSNAVTLPNGSAAQLPVGGAAAYKTLTVQQLRAARALGHAVLNVYAGDSFLASATVACSLPPAPANTPIYDAVAQRQMPYDAHILGNHEFDFGPDFLEEFIRSFEVNGVLVQPFLSANLDFSGEPGFNDLVDADGILVGYNTDGRVIAGSAIIVDEVTGQRFGIVSATTPSLPTISSPRNVKVTSTDIPSTASVVQTEIDRLTDEYGVRKIIFVSHLQDLNNDRQLVRLLSGVDIAVAGGGDELLTNPNIPNSTQLLPGEQATRAGDYPLRETDANGRTVYLVTTAGNYKYLGQVEAVFNAAGEITSINAQRSYPRRVIPTGDVATQLGLTDAVEKDEGIVETVDEPVSECLADFAAPIAASEVQLNVSRNGVSSQPGLGVRNAETNAGNHIADSFLYAYDRYADDFGLPARSASNPVIAVQNGGGIRQNAGDFLPTSGTVPGTISRLDTLNVLAFLTNSVSVVNNVTPQDLKDILERSAASLPGQGGQFLQIGGFSVVYDQRNTAQLIATDGTVTRPGTRVISVVLEDGTVIVENGQVVAGAPNVRLVTNSFTAAGGDNYPWLRDNANKVQFPATYEQAWVEYLLTFPVDFQGLPTIQSSDARYAPGGEGRISILK